MDMSDSFGKIFQNRRVIVTGDTGFKGSWLCLWLRHLGAKVDGYALPPKSENDNYVKTGLHRSISHTDGDIRDITRFKDFLKKVQPDIIFHLAAQAIVLESYQTPIETFNTNVMGTANVLEAAREIPDLSGVVVITSDKCYQNNEWIWGYRETDPMGGRDPYSASKGAAELIVQSYQSSFFQDAKCRIVSARAGNVIGGGDWAEHRIVPDFFRAYFKNETLDIRNPYSIRPWQHVLEPLSGYLLLGQKLLEGDKSCAGGWNFGPFLTHHKTVWDLIQGLLTITKKGHVRYAEAAQKMHEANLLKLDISKALHYLNWKPVLNFEETVEFTVKGYLDEYLPSDLYQARIEQLDKYVDIAQKNNLEWTQ